MSDTTITAEERARLRSVLSEHGNPQVEDRIILRLLNTVEQAEARAEKAEKELAGADAEITELRDELEDSRGTEKDAPNVLCAIARLVGVYEHCQELGDDMGTMSLDAVRDLLAEKQKPRALPWTHEPPKVAGFFFAESSLDDCSKKITPIEVFSPDHWRHSDWEKKHGKLSCLLCLGGFGVCPVSRYSRFAGPIAPPIEE